MSQETRPRWAGGGLGVSVVAEDINDVIVGFVCHQVMLDRLAPTALQAVRHAKPFGFTCGDSDVQYLCPTLQKGTISKPLVHGIRWAIPIILNPSSQRLFNVDAQRAKNRQFRYWPVLGQIPVLAGIGELSGYRAMANARSLGRSIARSLDRSIARSLDSLDRSIARLIARLIARSLDRSLDRFDNPRLIWAIDSYIRLPPVVQTPLSYSCFLRQHFLLF